MTPFQIAVLGSGSKGNATIMRCASGTVLIDAGISCRRIMQGMKSLGISPETLSAVFLTHEHIDHVRGLETFVKNTETPIYASAGTWQGIRHVLLGLDMRQCNSHILKPDAGVLLGGLSVKSFSVSHDALEPSGYTFTHKDHLFAYVTDTGYISDTVKQALEGAESLVLEANHDVMMLKNGRYAPALKKRILGVKGHLSNDSAAYFLSTLKHLPKEVFLAHLSHENNTQDMALTTVQGIVTRHHPGETIRYYVTSQDRLVKNEAWEDYHEQNIFE